MSEHTPTPWWTYPNPMRSDGVFVAAGERKDEYPPQYLEPQLRTKAEHSICGSQVKPADGERLTACVNAFHSPTRSIATGNIPEGLVWKMHDLLEIWVAGEGIARGIGLIGAKELLASLKVEQSDDG